MDSKIILYKFAGNTVKVILTKITTTKEKQNNCVQQEPQNDNWKYFLEDSENKQYDSENSSSDDNMVSMKTDGIEKLKSVDMLITIAGINFEFIVDSGSVSAINVKSLATRKSEKLATTNSLTIQINLNYERFLMNW